MAVTKLAVANFAAHRIRVALTVAAIALSVSLVVAVTSGYSSIEAAVQLYISQYMGSTDIIISKKGDYRGGVSEELVKQIAADPDVQRAVGRAETETAVLDPDGGHTPNHDVDVVGVRLPDDVEVNTLHMEQGTTGGWFQGDSGDVTVIDQEAAKLLKNVKKGEDPEKVPPLQVGDDIILPLPNNERLTLKVVGIVHKPQLLASYSQTIYIPLATLQKMINTPGQVNRIMVNLKPSANDHKFVERWQAKLGGGMKLRLARDNRKEADDNFQGIHYLSYLGSTISMTAAAFIIFSTLSMGVAERSRILAMLRSIGAFKSQVAWLVVIEALILALSGIALGLPLGWLWMKLLVWQYPDFFPIGVVLSGGGLLFAISSSLIAAISASILPAYHATRVTPLEGMSPLARTTTNSTFRTVALAGLLLVLIDPIVAITPGLPQPIRIFSHFVIGLPCLMLGFFLMSPMLIKTLEKVLGRPIAWIMGVNHTLLRHQLSGALWRAAGTASALMVGLGVLVALQTNSNTALNGWKLPNKFPDMFVVSKFLGLNEKQVAALADVPGVNKNQILPIAIATPGLNLGPIAALIGKSTMFFGVDPDKVLEMMELDFRSDDGTPPSHDKQIQLAKYAIEKLKLGRHVIITDEMRSLKGLKVGDKVNLDTSVSGNVEYTVCGIVWSPGIDVMVSVFELGRQFDERSASSVFGSLADARRDFGINNVHLVAINLNNAGEKKQVEERIQKAVGGWGLEAYDVRHIKFGIQRAFIRILHLASAVAYAAIAVASLGVANTIMASIRSRRWQLGILRSIGVTRSQMLRMLLAEGILLGIVGSILGFASGMEMSFNSHSMNRFIFGYNPPLDIPWSSILAGVGIIIFVAFIASLWPAATTARSDPLTLLQAGRAAA